MAQIPEHIVALRLNTSKGEFFLNLSIISHKCRRTLTKKAQADACVSRVKLLENLWKCLKKKYLLGCYILLTVKMMQTIHLHK